MIWRLLQRKLPSCLTSPIVDLRYSCWTQYPQILSLRLIWLHPLFRLIAFIAPGTLSLLRKRPRHFDQTHRRLISGKGRFSIVVPLIFFLSSALFFLFRVVVVSACLGSLRHQHLREPQAWELCCLELSCSETSDPDSIQTKRAC